MLETTTAVAPSDSTLTLHAARELTVFAVETAMTQLVAFRDSASVTFQKYELPGRNATIDLMARIYKVWFDAMQASQGDFDSFIGNIKQKLKDEGTEFKSSSTAAGVLIRYVFKDATDKQVHIYGRSLEVAYAKQTAKDEFELLVRATDGGFDGLRAEAVLEKGTGADRTVKALSACVNQPTLETIDGMTWEGGEKYRVFIAVRNADDTADIKDSLLDADKRKSVLLQFQAAKSALDTPPKPKALSKAQKAVIKSLEADVAQQEAKVERLKMEMKVAAKSDPAFARDLEVEVAVAEATLRAFERSLESVKPAKPE